MTCRGADEGRGTEEKSLSPVSGPRAKPPVTQPTKNSVNLPEKEEEASAGIDLFVQAQKSLSERSPFDAEDATAHAVTSLPASLLCFLAKHLDSSKKRQKKLHSGLDAKPSKSEQPKSSNIWTATEEYFRQLTYNDIERLHDASSIDQITNSNLLLILSSQNSNGIGAADTVLANGAETNEGGVAFSSDFGDVVKEDVKENDGAGKIAPYGGEKTCFMSQPSPSCSVEWLLGSRERIYLSSDHPSNNKKNSGGDAGLNKLLVVRPVKGNSSLCHVCCLGDMKDSWNHLIVCGSCKVAVHQKCYGVRGEVDESWLCSWCKNGNEIGKTPAPSGSDWSLRPCVLCPLHGGALKPVHNSGRLPEFAHLFCSQWMPEVFVEDTRLMEPIMNVGGIKETWRKIICYICREKCGPCVQCSNGACRISFHPICAREAGNRMEIWGKFGGDTVVLRAFCSMHSEIKGQNIWHSDDSSIPVGFHPCIANQPVILSLNKPQLLNVGPKNGNQVAVHPRAEMDPDNSPHGESPEMVMLDKKSVEGLPECEDVDPSGYLISAQVLKKLILRGKVDTKNVASDIGISPELLSATLSDDCIVPGLHCKLVNWLRNHAHVGTLKKGMKVKTKSDILSKADLESKAVSHATNLSDSDFPDVYDRTADSQRIVKSNVRILKDIKAQCTSKAVFDDSGIRLDEGEKGQGGGADNPTNNFGLLSTAIEVVADKFDNNQSRENDTGDSSKDSLPSAVDKLPVGPVSFQDSLANQSPKSEGISFKFGNSGSESCQVGGDSRYDKSICVASESPHCCVVEHAAASDLINAKTTSRSYIHPFIAEKLMQLQAGLFGSSSSSVAFSTSQSLYSASMCGVKKNDVANSEQLIKARDMGLMLSPEDEVEGELIYFQHRLLNNAIAKKKFIEDLICKVAKRIPAEIDAAHKQMWDSVLVNRYLGELRELKKQGRKERRYKEAQAVLAAAAAAAASSSRVSSLRKESLDESVYQNSTRPSTASLRSGMHPRENETLSKVAGVRISSERHSDSLCSTSSFSKEHPRLCDVCWLSGTALNPLLTCFGCKVAVHLDCYHLVKDSTGLWYCELCAELLSCKCSRAPVVDSWECSLCGGTNGAFKKAATGQWIHAFCAEWVFESTFRRGQVNLVEGMETVLKDRDICYICHRNNGVSLKCNHGHCQSTFHAFCARVAGLYMNVKANGGLLQHTAFCEKHSIEQRAKVDIQKQGVEEFRTMKQIRVELERLRLLCERIVKREKLKRELVLCSHDILASKRDTVAFSTLIHSPFFLPDASSESATTSLKSGHSRGMQRSDDITVDSLVSGKRCVSQKAVDSGASQYLLTPKPTDRALFAGKKLPHRPSSLPSLPRSDVGDRQMKARKHAETFQKELIMTSDQASMKNQRLPKGYVYVPIGCLSNETRFGQGTPRGDEMSEHDDG